MPEARVVDTNVLIVASAADGSSPFRPESTPVQEANLRLRVLDWVIALEHDSNRHVVLDRDSCIWDEYRRKLTDQDYGWLAIRSKVDRNEVIWVELELDLNDHALLPPELADAVTDLEDRKMVAAVLAASEDQQCILCSLANACDTDWLDCEEALKTANVSTEHLIEDWLRAKWRCRHATPQ